MGNSSATAEGSVSSGDLEDCSDGKETDKDGKKKKNRCAICRKKVGLTGEHKDIDFEMLRHKVAACMTH